MCPGLPIVNTNFTIPRGSFGEGGILGSSVTADGKMVAFIDIWMNYILSILENLRPDTAPDEAIGTEIEPGTDEPSRADPQVGYWTDRIPLRLAYKLN